MTGRQLSPGATYRQVQSRKPWFVWPIVLVVALVGWWILIQEVVLGRQVGDGPTPPTVVWIVWLVTSVGLPLLVARMRLVVEVDDRTIACRVWPTWPRRIRLDQIASVEPRTYRPIREYLGWGVRWTPHAGWAYTLSGCRGVQLVLKKGGRRVLVGADRPEELADEVRRRLGRD